MDTELKNDMEVILLDMGLSMSSAMSIFARKVVRNGKIPFEIEADPFYLAENQAELRRRIELHESGMAETRTVTLEELANV